MILSSIYDNKQILNVFVRVSYSLQYSERVADILGHHVYEYEIYLLINLLSHLVKLLLLLLNSVIDAFRVNVISRNE